LQCDCTRFEEPEKSFLAIPEPSRRLAKDENVAGLIAFLWGPQTEDINGIALPIDGAWTAGRG
jgi:3-hydroxybutyrate dehydrogenase